MESNQLLLIKKVKFLKPFCINFCDIDDYMREKKVRLKKQLHERINKEYNERDEPTNKLKIYIMHEAIVEDHPIPTVVWCTLLFPIFINILQSHAKCTQLIKFIPGSKEKATGMPTRMKSGMTGNGKYPTVYLIFLRSWS